MNSRAIAAQILAAVIQQKRSLNTALAERLADYSSAQDRGFIQELSYGVLRWYWQLNEITKHLLDHPLKIKDIDIQALLLIGIYQLLHLQTPPHAAIHETVQAARELNKTWATKLINGVLRRFQREQKELLAKIELIPAAHYAHSSWLFDAVQHAWPHNWETIVTANNQYPPMTLRVNCLQQTREKYLQLLAEKNIAASPAQHTTYGITLAEPCDISQLPSFAEGMVSVQDGAAQLAAELLELAPGQRVLDACAAPGGKTAHILEMEPNLDQLVVIDVAAERLNKVRENLKRLKLHPHPIVICADAAQPAQWWDGQLFDRILLDAPCSATGVIRRHPDIKLLRRPEDIAQLVTLQEKLLNALWPLLKPGGLLLYATCSVLPQENNLQLEKFLAEHTDATLSIRRQILPEVGGMDGFYYGRIIKNNLSLCAPISPKC
jgi:16S rRNA (cytosine967-C5)-methyltransferase